jgi:CubicO group peptidase (beta-lactamase class C family)
MNWERVKGCAGSRGGVWSLLVLRGDEVVCEARQGCGPDDLFYTFSVGKPLTALAVHLLAHRGLLDLDAPIAHYWPRYARRGKSQITPRQVLAHSAGVALSTGWIVTEMAAMRSWRLSVKLAEWAKPTSAPGTRFQYHVISFGFILGELVRRVDGRPIERFVHEELFTPLGLEHSFLGLPRGYTGRSIPLHGHRPVDRFTAFGLNRKSGRRAVAPAASLQTTARDLATFYRVCLRDGATADGRQAIPAEVITAARARTYPEVTRYGTGFQLGGMGAQAHPQTFGHNGSNVCTAWADPVEDTVFVYLTDYYLPTPPSYFHMALLSDAVLELGPGSRPRTGD